MLILALASVSARPTASSRLSWFIRFGSNKEFTCSKDGKIEEIAHYDQASWVHGGEFGPEHPLFDVDQLEEPAETDQLCGKSIKTLTMFCSQLAGTFATRCWIFMAWVYRYEVIPHTPLQPRYPKVIIQLKIIWSQAKGRGPESVERSSHLTRVSSVVETDLRYRDRYLPVCRYYKAPGGCFQLNIDTAPAFSDST